MEQPRIFVINDPIIAEGLDRKIDEPFKHIDQHADWMDICKQGEIFIVNTSSKHASVGLNPFACIAEYHELVLEVLTNNEPPVSLADNEVWQPATWLDCDTESTPLSRAQRISRSRLGKIGGCIDTARRTKRNNVSRIIHGLDDLPRAIDIVKRFREHIVKQTLKKEDNIAFSTLLDHYLKHGDLKRLTRKPKS
ncbi:MAG: hypothetical protein K9M03_00110 [Kiritimatiellales bacterium]|nr:hypothetical protein [Kiritimatiellales bacterium]